MVQKYKFFLIYKYLIKIFYYHNIRVIFLRISQKRLKIIKFNDTFAFCCI
jgi:GH25 family lysozyme M1 (1,4-beta-N-acetylmuramidase)